MLIILDLTVTKSGEEVGGKIGEPVIYDANKSRAQQQQPTATKPPPPQNKPFGNKPMNNNSMSGSGNAFVLSIKIHL